MRYSTINMKGSIEIYQHGSSGEKLIFSEDNMIVDGARKQIVDILSFRSAPSSMSLSPSAFSGVGPMSGTGAVSAAFDASNFGIKAITLGPAHSAFRARDSRFYPSSVLDNSQVDQVYNLKPRLTNSLFSSATHNQLGPINDPAATPNIVPDIWDTDFWPGSQAGGWVLTNGQGALFSGQSDGGVVFSSNNVGDVVVLTAGAALSPGSLPLTPNTHFRFDIRAKSEGLGAAAGWIEGYDSVEFRLRRLLKGDIHGPADYELWYYYDFDKGVFDSALPKGKKIPLGPTKKWNSISFRTPSDRWDIDPYGLTYDYVVDLVIPAYSEIDKFSKIHIYNTRLYDLDNSILINTDLKYRDSFLRNSDFLRRVPSEILSRNGFDFLAENNGYFEYDGWWNDLGNPRNEIPLFSSTQPIADNATHASVKFISSSVDLLDGTSEGYISFRSALSGIPGNAGVGSSSCSVITKFTVPPGMISDRWIHDPDYGPGLSNRPPWSEIDVDEKTTFNLSFWHYGASANPGFLDVFLKTQDGSTPTNTTYNVFNHSVNVGGNAFRPKHWANNQGPNFLDEMGPAAFERITPVYGEWTHFSKDIFIPRRAIDAGAEYIMYMTLSGTAGATHLFDEVFIKDIKFGPIPGFYSNTNTSSTLTYASDGGIDLSFKYSVYDEEFAFNGNHLTARLRQHISPHKSYIPMITYSSDTAVGTASFDMSIFKKFTSGNASGVDGDPAGASFYQWADASGVWASSLDDAKITLKGTGGATVTSSLPPVFGWETIQRETIPLALTNHDFQNGDIGEEVSGTNGQLGWYLWKNTEAGQTGAGTGSGNIGEYDDGTGSRRCVQLELPSDAAGSSISLIQRHPAGSYGGSQELAGMDSRKHYRARFWAAVDNAGASPLLRLAGATHLGGQHFAYHRGHSDEEGYNQYEISPTTTWTQYEIDFWGDPRGDKFEFQCPGIAANNSRKFYITDIELFEAEGILDPDEYWFLSEEVLLRIQQNGTSTTTATIKNIRFVDAALIAHTDHPQLDSNLENMGSNVANRPPLWDLPGTSEGEDVDTWAWDNGWRVLNDPLDRTRHAKLNSSGTDTWLEVISPYKRNANNCDLQYIVPDIKSYGYKTGDKIAFSFDHCETGCLDANTSWIVSLHAKMVKDNKPDSYYTWNVNSGEWVDGDTDRVNIDHLWAVGPSASDWLNWSSDEVDTKYSRTPKSPEMHTLFDADVHPDISQVDLKFLLSPRITDEYDGVSRIRNFRTYSVSSWTDTTGMKPIMPNPIDKTLQPSSLDGSGPDKLGHFLNYIEFSSTAGSALTLEEVLDHGCYLPGSGLSYMGSATFGTTTPDGSIDNTLSGTPSGTLNERGVINSDGFILENPKKASEQSLLDSSAGFVVSSLATATVSGLSAANWIKGHGREVKYILTIMYSDWKFLDYYYGGIGSMGLWTVDYPATIKKLKGENGHPPLWVSSTGTPYPSSLYNLTDTTLNPVFRLFAKKVFFPGGLKIDETTNYKDYITIIWSIKF